MQRGMKPIFEIVRRGSGANSVAIFPAAGPTENALYPKHKQIADAEDLKTYKYGMKGIKGQICRRTKINLERGRGASLILLWTKMHLCVTFVGGSIRLRRTAYMRTGFLLGCICSYVGFGQMRGATLWRGCNCHVGGNAKKKPLS